MKDMPPVKISKYQRFHFAVDNIINKLEIHSRTQLKNAQVQKAIHSIEQY